MKVASMVAVGLLGGWAWSAASAAGPPPMERPTPPPCCADGLCYPNPVTWGHYATRWRRWPTDYLEPRAPGVTPPAPLGPDVPPYEAPPAEEEDRRAPPPSAPRAAPPTTEEGAPTPQPNGPATGTPPTAPLGPPTGPVRPRPALPLEEPQDDSPRSLMPLDDAPPPTTLPFGGEPPTSPLPFGEPMGEMDPPPAPPFVKPSMRSTPATRAATAPIKESNPRATSEPNRKDPPPSPPIAMARWTR